MGHNISWTVPRSLLHVSTTTNLCLLFKAFSFDVCTFPRSWGQPKIPHWKAKSRHWKKWVTAVFKYLMHVSATTKFCLLFKTFSFDASTIPRCSGQPKIPHLGPKSRNWDKWVITFHGLSRGLYCMYRLLLTYVCLSRRSASTCVPSRDPEANQRFLTEEQSRDTGKNGSQQSRSI